MISACFLMLYSLACKSVPENGQVYANKGLTYPRDGLKDGVFCKEARYRDLP